MKVGVGYKKVEIFSAEAELKLAPSVFEWMGNYSFHRYFVFADH